MSEDTGDYQHGKNWHKTGIQGQEIHEFHHYRDGVMTAELLGYVRHDPLTGKWQVIRPEPDLYDTADDARLALFGAADFDAWDGTTPPPGYSSTETLYCKGCGCEMDTPADACKKDPACLCHSFHRSEGNA